MNVRWLEEIVRFAGDFDVLELFALINVFIAVLAGLISVRINVPRKHTHLCLTVSLSLSVSLPLYLCLCLFVYV